MKKYNICETDNFDLYEVLKEKKMLGSISKDSLEILDELNSLYEENNILKYSFENCMMKALNKYENNLEAKKIIKNIENIYYNELKQGIDF